MLLGKVTGHVWATRKDDRLTGMKLLVVKTRDGKEIVACDYIGAGNGDEVLVVTGSSARRILGSEDIPIDASIVGIIDQIDS